MKNLKEAVEFTKAELKFLELGILLMKEETLKDKNADIEVYDNILSKLNKVIG